MNKENSDAIIEEIDIVKEKLANVPLVGRDAYIEWCVAEWEEKGHTGTYAELCAEVAEVKERADENYANYMKERFFKKRVKIVKDSDLRDAFYYNSDLPTLPNGNKVFEVVYERALKSFVDTELMYGTSGSLIEVLKRFKRDEDAIMDAVRVIGVVG